MKKVNIWLQSWVLLLMVGLLTSIFSVGCTDFDPGGIQDYIDENLPKKNEYVRCLGENWLHQPKPEFDLNDPKPWEYPNSNHVFGKHVFRPYDFETCYTEEFNKPSEACHSKCVKLFEKAKSEGGWDWFTANLTGWPTTDYPYWTTDVDLFGMPVKEWRWHMPDDEDDETPTNQGYMVVAENFLAKCRSNTHPLKINQTCVDEDDEKLNGITSGSHAVKAFSNDIEKSSATISVDIQDYGRTYKRSLISGKANYGFGTLSQCETETCELRLGELTGRVQDFRVYGEGDYEDDYVTASGIRYYLLKEARGTYKSDSGKTTFEPQEISLLLEFTYGEKYGNFILKNTSEATATFNPKSNTFAFSGVFRQVAAAQAAKSSDLTTTLTLSLTGDFERTPPVANTSHPTVAECTGNYSADVVVDGSSKPYSVDKTHWWWVEHDFGAVPDDENTKIATLNIPLGKSRIYHVIQDSAGGNDSITTSIEVVDTTPPEIVAQPATYSSCVPNETEVLLDSPQVSDECSSSSTITLEAFLKEMNGKDAGMVPIANNLVVLSVGTHTIEWVATDEFGNVTKTNQVITLKHASGESCCQPDQTVLLGTDKDDKFKASNEPLCILSYGGNDRISMLRKKPLGNEYIAVGNGDDWVKTRKGKVVIIAEDGDDFINCASSEGKIYAGNGNDKVNCSPSNGPNHIWGGYGNDKIHGGKDSDVIAPGPGIDFVHAGDGDDTVYLYDICELVSGKALYGDEGSDVLYLPVSEEEALSMGVVIEDFETIELIDPALSGFSDCAWESDKS